MRYVITQTVKLNYRCIFPVVVSIFTAVNFTGLQNIVSYGAIRLF
jgi:hypothetical protein